MPELPEVERGRRLAERVAKGKCIRRAHIVTDPIVLDGHSPAQLKNALVGRCVIAVKRWGKQLWFELDRAPHPLWHFGMTGAFHLPGGEALQLQAGPKADRDDWPPRFLKVLLGFEDGSQLAFCDARRFGRVRLRMDPEREPPVSRLGFDPLLGMPLRKGMMNALSQRKSPIKSVLLDQKFAAGVGNWIADEVLYQAGIAPHRRACELSLEEVGRMRAKLGRIVRTAVAANADDKAYPRTWLFHRRWGKQSTNYMPGGACIEFTEIGGRTTAWVPSCQN